MAIKVTEHLFRGPTTPYTSYDSTKTNLGALIRQFTGATSLDKYAGPLPVSIIRPMEAGTAFPVMYPHIIQWSTTKYWVFSIENTTAASAARRVLWVEYDAATGLATWK